MLVYALTLPLSLPPPAPASTPSSLPVSLRVYLTSTNSNPPVIANATHTGLARLTSVNNINITDERWTLTQLRDPVIDERGKPVVTSAWVEPKVANDDTSLATNEQLEFAQMAKDIFQQDDDDDVLGQMAAGDSSDTKGKHGKSRPANKAKERQMRKAAEAAEAAKPSEVKQFTLDIKGNMIELDKDGKEIKQEEKIDPRKRVSWRGPYMRTAAANKKFEEDFSHVCICATVLCCAVLYCSTRHLPRPS